MISFEQNKPRAYLEERINSFLHDNYFVVVKIVSNEWAFVKLRHRKNANVIIMNCDLKNDDMVQRTNNKITYEGRVLP